MELFILGLLVGAGAAKSKAVTKAMAKSYMNVADVTKSMTTNIRDDMRGAIEEARVERDLDDGAAGAAVAPEPAVVAPRRRSKADRADDATTSARAAAVETQRAAHKPAQSILKSIAKGYVVVADKAKSAAADMREDVRDAIEEARYEHTHAAKPQAETAHAPEAVAEEPTPRTKRAYKRRSTTAAANAKSASAAEKPKTRRPRAATGATAPAAPKRRTRASKPAPGSAAEAAEIIGKGAEIAEVA